jgi:hypothetical protein
MFYMLILRERGRERMVACFSLACVACLRYSHNSFPSFSVFHISVKALKASGFKVISVDFSRSADADISIVLSGKSIEEDVKHICEELQKSGISTFGSFLVYE